MPHHLRTAAAPSLNRRQGLLVLGSLLLPVGATQAAEALMSAMVRLDGLYIPALFLTGAAPKSADGPAKARAATARLVSAWPGLQQALQTAGPSDTRWGQTLAEVGRRITEAQVLVERGSWAQSHEVLEHVRLALFETRRRLGMAYLLDDFTAFHEVMEKITGLSSPAADGVRPLLAQARQSWQVITSARIEPATWGLSAARAQQLQQSLQAETAALERLAAALDTPTALAAAATAIKGPFIQAYTAFGWPPGEAEPTPA